MSLVVKPPVMRDHGVSERASTPLELLFDLCFVVAVSFLATELHHGVTAGQTARSIIAYLLIFIPIWWAWMNYTWYATAFSHDDAITRVLTVVQMLGILAVSATIPAVFHNDLLPFALCYAAMRLPLIIQWLRSAIGDPPNRVFALYYAGGAVIAQLLWVLGSVVPTIPRVAIFSVALFVELSAPVLAVRAAPGPVAHNGHIAERYGLFTIIVLGESILAVTLGLREVVAASAVVPSVIFVVAATLVIAFALWWLYFDVLGSDALTRNLKSAFAWGYGHYAIFAAIAAVGVGLRVTLDSFVNVSSLTAETGAMLTSLAVAVVLAAVLVLGRLSEPLPIVPFAAGTLACLALASSASVLGAALTFVLLAVATVAVVVTTCGQHQSTSETDASLMVKTA